MCRSATWRPSAFHLLYDGHGSTRAVVDAAGAIQQRYGYDAYGKMLSGAALTSDLTTALVSLLYSGEKTDKTGLQYLRARYYDPANGRFVGLDPFGGNLQDPQSLHKYLYTHGNPVMGIDPSGMMEGLAGLGTAMSIGANRHSLRIRDWCMGCSVKIRRHVRLGPMGCGNRIPWGSHWRRIVRWPRSHRFRRWRFREFRVSLGANCVRRLFDVRLRIRGL